MADEWTGRLDKERERLRLAVEQLDTSDIQTFFIAIGELRESVGRASPAFLKLNAELDLLISARMQSYFNQILREAQRDPLTGLGHRGAFDQRLKSEIERNHRYQRQFALILFDLDHFKTLNDRFGHLAGDRILVHFADSLRSGLRQSDEPFRIGGDEFAAILPETRLLSGDTIGHRIEQLISPAGSGTAFGVSWGVANWPGDCGFEGGSRDIAGSAELMLLTADQRLYAEKARKRNLQQRLDSPAP